MRRECVSLATNSLTRRRGFSVHLQPKQEFEAWVDGLPRGRQKCLKSQSRLQFGTRCAEEKLLRLRIKQVSHRRVRLGSELLAQGRLFLSLNRLHHRLTIHAPA